VVDFQTVTERKKWIRVTDMVADDAPPDEQLSTGKALSWTVNPLQGNEDQGGLVTIQTAKFKAGDTKPPKDFEPGVQLNVFDGQTYPI